MSKQSKKSSSSTTQHTDQHHAPHASQRQPKRRIQRRGRSSRLWFVVGGGALVVLIAVIALLVFHPTKPNLPNGSTISPQALKQAIDSQAKMTIVDVRTVEEYNAGHINNSVLLPLDTLASKAAEGLPDKIKYYMFIAGLAIEVRKLSPSYYSRDIPISIASVVASLPGKMRVIRL